MAMPGEVRPISHLGCEAELPGNKLGRCATLRTSVLPQSAVVFAVRVHHSFYIGCKDYTE